MRYSIPLSRYLNPHPLVLHTACLPLWLILSSGMVTLLTLSFLPNRHHLPNSWTCFSFEYLSKLTKGFYLAGRSDDSDTASSMLELVGYATPDQVFARISRSGDIMVPRDIGRPSSCGPATLVGNTVRSPSVASHGRLLIR